MELVREHCPAFSFYSLKIPKVGQTVAHGCIRHVERSSQFAQILGGLVYKVGHGTFRHKQFGGKLVGVYFLLVIKGKTVGDVSITGKFSVSSASNGFAQMPKNMVSQFMGNSEATAKRRLMLVDVNLRYAVFHSVEAAGGASFLKRKDVHPDLGGY